MSSSPNWRQKTWSRYLCCQDLEELWESRKWLIPRL
jgi:hypothetical protein